MVEPRAPGKYQTRIRPWQSTRVVGFLNGPKLGVGNADMSLLSTGAGASGVPEGMWWAMVALAKEAASQGTVSVIG